MRDFRGVEMKEGNYYGEGIEKAMSLKIEDMGMRPDGNYVVTIKTKDGSILTHSWPSANPNWVSGLLAPVQPNFIQIKKGENDYDIYPINMIEFANVKFVPKANYG